MLTKPGQIGSDAYKTDKGYSVFRLKEILPADDKKFEKDRETFTERLRLVKGQQYLQQWLKYIRSTSTIKIEDGLI